jgi:hypothetical protein
MIDPDHWMVHMKPFRFGVNVGSAKSRIEWIEKARKIEALLLAARRCCRRP